MNWIIRSTKTIKFHTNLQAVLSPIWEDLTAYKWILTDLDFISNDLIPINFDNDFFLLEFQKFGQLYQSNTQIIWGLISAIPQNIDPDLTLIPQLSAEDPQVWTSDHFLIKEGIMEIIAFDSGYTIVKFKDQHLSDKFKDYFQDQALDLQKFAKKHIK